MGSGVFKGFGCGTGSGQAYIGFRLPLSMILRAPLRVHVLARFRRFRDRGSIRILGFLCFQVFRLRAQSFKGFSGYKRRDPLRAL